MMTTKNSLGLKIIDGGLIDYPSANVLQKKFCQDVIQGNDPVLIFCEHPPVITKGRTTQAASLLFPEEEIRAQGIQVFTTDRGGEVTAHNPGQLVIYPILNLKDHGRDLRLFLQKLQDTAVELLRDFGIVASTSDDRRGVWAGPDKLVSLGIGVRQWVSYHGLAINVHNDLDIFKWIKPCGLDVRMTSMERLKPNQHISVRDVQAEFLKHFIRIFNF